MNLMNDKYNHKLLLEIPSEIDAWCWRRVLWIRHVALAMPNKNASQALYRYISDLQMSCRAPSQYPKRRLIVRSREVSKSRDLYLELSDRSEIWQALRQHCCRCACQISKRYDNLKYQSRGFETSRDLTIRRLFGYWDGAQGFRVPG